MAIRLVTFESEGSASVLASHLAGELERSGRATLLAPSFDAGSRCRRELARRGAGLGIDVLTPEAWLGQVWELFGDGSALVGTTQRQILMANVVSQAAERGELAPLADTPGTERMLARMARDLAPYIAEKQAASEAEAAVFSLVGSYVQALDERGLVELSEASARLLGAVGKLAGEGGGLPRALGSVSLSGVASLPGHLVNFLAGLSGLGAQVTFLLAGEERAFAAALREAFAGKGAEVAEESLRPADAAGFGAFGDAQDGASLASASLGSAAVSSNLETASGKGTPGSPSVPACAGAESVCGNAAANKPALEFLEVAGPHAKARAYAEEIMRLAREQGGDAPIVTVVAARPSELADELAPRLAALGAESTWSRFARFSDTAAGRAFNGLSDLVGRMSAADAGELSDASWWPAPELTDWLYNPLSGCGAAQARAFDKKIRSKRAMGTDGVRRYLQSIQGSLASERKKLDESDARHGLPCVCSQVFQYLEQKRPVSALKSMAVVAAQAPDSTFGKRMGQIRRIEELTCANKAADLLENGSRELDVPQAVAVRALDAVSVFSRAEMKPAGGDGPAAHVRFMTLEQAAELTPGSTGSVFFADVDAGSYPLAHEEGPLATLSARLGAPRVSIEPAALLRERVARVLRAASGPCTLARVTHDRQAKDRYPAAVWTELAAATGAEARCVGEGAVVADFDLSSGEGLGCERAWCEAPQHLGETAVPYVVLRERAENAGKAEAAAEGGSPFVPRLTSASQIEAYTSCPLCWFISSRLRPQALDAGFSNMEKGNFVHDVLYRLHARIIEEGLGRVTPENLDTALGLLDAVFAEVRAEHACGKTSSSAALVPLSPVEEVQIDDILPQLRSVVRYEASALPPFRPSYLEYSFNELGVTYAGRPLGGRIDRVDVDAEGRAVVIDYKHRNDVNPFKLKDPTAPDKNGERAADDPDWLPEHTQTLIYAQAIRRALGLEPRAALYFSTKGKDPAMRGAAAAELVDAASGEGQIPGLREGFPAEGGSMTFEDLLDRCEARIAERMRAMDAGDVAATDKPSMRCSYNHPFGFTRREA